MGNIVEIFENGRTACRYEYDALNRLTREDNVAFGKTTTWAYDNNGNIIAKYEYATYDCTSEYLESFIPDEDNRRDFAKAYRWVTFALDATITIIKGLEAFSPELAHITAYNKVNTSHDYRVVLRKSGQSLSLEELVEFCKT